MGSTRAPTIDATILIPTYRHAELLPFALSSALAQKGVDIQVLVVGDGVEDDTRAALAPFLSDPRVRVYDFPKGKRNGELHRHRALQDAAGRIVCYLSDDDLILRDHVAEMAGLLEDADFAHGAPFFVLPDESFEYGPVDLSRPEFHELLRGGGWNQISLTGAAHTLAAYRRLPHGWRPAPSGVWSDLYMWQQFVELPGFKGATGTRLTHLHFASEDRRDAAVADRVSEVERWWTLAQEPGFEAGLAPDLEAAVRASAVRRELRLHALKRAIREIQATRWWRARTRVATLRPVRWLVGTTRRAR